MRDGPPGVRSVRALPREWIPPVIALSKRTCELLTVNSRGENRDRSARGNFYFDTRKREDQHAEKEEGKKNQSRGNRAFI